MEAEGKESLLLVVNTFGLEASILIGLLGMYMTDLKHEGLLEAIF